MPPRRAATRRQQRYGRACEAHCFVERWPPWKRWVKVAVGTFAATRRADRINAGGAMAIVIPVDTREAVWTGPDGRVRSFRPSGKRRSEGLIPNRRTWSSKETWAARLFVGFNVGHDTVWEMDDLVAIVRTVREAQTNNPA